MKTKPLLPTLRERKRYIVYEVLAKEKLDGRDVGKAISNEIMSYIGVKGFSEAGILHLHDKWTGTKGIMRVSHTSIDEVKMALALTKSVSGEEVIIRSVGTSGILKKAQEKYAG